MMFIKTNMLEICGYVDKYDNVKDLLKTIDEQFTTYHIISLLYL